jgi:PAS domain S-box-containing protein
MTTERKPSRRPGGRAGRGGAPAADPGRGVDERFHLLVARVRDYGIVLLDPKGRVLSWNDGAAKIEGYRPAEIIGQSMSRFYTEEDVRRGRPARLLRQARSRGSVEDEGWRIRKDGSRYWTNVVITALRDRRGRLLGFAKLMRDLTRRRLAEAALRESRERLRAILDHSPSIMFLKDVEGRYLDCNPPFEALCGRRRDEIIGRTDADLLPGAQAAQFRANDREVLAAGAPMRFEETAIHPDGEHISLVSKFPLRDGEGRIYAVGGIVTDITDRKRAEESLRQLSSRLLQVQDEEQERLAGELHRGVAQALDTLQAQLALVKKSGTLFDWKTSQALDASLKLARETSKEVRTLSRLLYPSLLDDAGLVEALRWYTGGFSQRTGIKIMLDVPPKVGRLAREVGRSLFRVVQESLSNVQRHSGGTSVAVRLTEDAYSIRLEVTDDGKGIPEGILDGAGGTVAITGVGIRGMAERMRQLGGRLEIDSGDRGTTVRAILPASGARRSTARQGRSS